MKRLEPDNETAREAMDMLQAEIDIYRRQSDEYSHVFHSMKKA